jgi:hypothetical protein
MCWPNLVKSFVVTKLKKSKPGVLRKRNREEREGEGRKKGGGRREKDGTHIRQEHRDENASLVRGRSARRCRGVGFGGRFIFPGVQLQTAGGPRGTLGVGLCKIKAVD